LHPPHNRKKLRPRKTPLLKRKQPNKKRKKNLLNSSDQCKLKKFHLASIQRRYYVSSLKLDNVKKETSVNSLMIWQLSARVLRLICILIVGRLEIRKQV